MAGTLHFVMISALIKLNSMPSATPASIQRITGTPDFTMVPDTAPAMARIAPAERSMPLRMITIDIPRTQMPFTAYCCRISLRLVGV